MQTANNRAAPTKDGFVTPVKQVIRHESGGAPAVGPPIQLAEPERVTGGERLAALAALYAHLVEHHHLLGLSIELNFLVRLAAADDERPDSLAFYAELVYRPNFPSDAAFNAFRRQHDLFHQLADRSRLQRLNDRFLKPVCVGRAGGRRDFPEAQELFRQLLLRADSAEFSAALRDLLASSLLELDAQALQLPDSGVLPATVQEVSERIFRLRLLAKFLGLVTFRGLHSDEDIPEQVLTSSVQMRNRLPPPLDLLSCLQAAVRRRQLVITLPWLIEYICMMDRVSVLTAAHQAVFSLLVGLFRSLGRAAGLTRHNALFLRLQYENLYEIHSHVQNLHDEGDLAAADRRRVDEVRAEFGRLYLRPAELEEGFFPVRITRRCGGRPRSWWSG
ncbi:codanin-1-like [Pollicipes pollicipes]|uniref:codanin-1-like n=1 Tax=Pollicipes pollicipes TaxID=41117 RepID=UPI001884D984|nr:codanin-1-like [Pollicipes pollicipes]